MRISTAVPNLQKGEEIDDSIKRALTLTIVSDEYPTETWTHVYTAGSATDAIKDGGAGVAIYYPSGSTETSSTATRKHCSNYRAETEALIQAMSIIQDSTEVSPNVVFFTDALSVLEALSNCKLEHLAKAIQ